MYDIDSDFGEDDPPPKPDVIPVFLGLFLLVLAFFIMLVSISTFEENKSDLVMHSLTSAFTTVMSPSAIAVDFGAKDIDILSGEVFQEQVTNIFSTDIRVKKIETLKPGELMHVQIQADELFVDAEKTIRKDQYPLLDRIIAALSARAPGLRQDMEVVIGSRVSEGVALPVGQTLEMSRVGEIARLMLSRGCPPDSISVGIRPGNPDEVSIWFWLRGVQNTVERFEEAMDVTRKRPEPGAEPEIKFELELGPLEILPQVKQP